MATKTKKIAKKKRLGWHFLPDTMQLTNLDNRKAAVGKTLSIPAKQTPNCCFVGMHASDLPHQAAQFNKGPVLCRVEVWGNVDTRGNDKFCGRHRRVLWAHEITAKDATQLAKRLHQRFDPTSGIAISSFLKLAASMATDLFDRVILELAERKGLNAGGKVRVVPVKPPFDVKALLGQLMQRVIRTETDIMRDVGDFYHFDNGAGGDLFRDVVDAALATDKVIVVDGFTSDGRSGYVLRGRRR